MELPLPREKMLVKDHLWEKVTSDYQLTLECQGQTMMVLLNTQSANFRRVLSNGQFREFKPYFSSVEELFHSIQNPDICQIDHQKGALDFTIPSNNRKEKKRLVQVSLTKFQKMTNLEKLEQVVSKVIRRMNRAEKEVKLDNFQIHNQLKALREDINKNMSKSEGEIASLKNEIDRIQEDRKKDYQKTQKQMNESILDLKKLMQEKLNEEKKETGEKILLIKEQIKNVSQWEDRLHEWGVEVEQQIGAEIQLINNQLAETLEAMRGMKRYLQQIGEGVATMQLRRKFEKTPESEKKEMQKKNPSYLIGLSNKNFHLHTNKVTLKSQVSDYTKIYVQQLLMNIVVKWMFSFSVRIVKSKQNFITVGVVDRIKQQEEPHFILSGNAVCYYGVEGGSMHYGEDGQCKQKETGDELCEGMEIKVTIDGFRVTFTLTHRNKKTKTHSITSDILGQSHRQFVPFIQLAHADDCIEWSIQ